MKTIKSSVLLAALGLVLSAVTSQALPYFSYNVQATVYEQAPSTVSGSKTTYNTYTVKITTKDILNLIAENYGHADGYYSGDSLVEYNFLGYFYIINGNPNKGGALVMDVGHDLLWDTYDSPWPYSGTYNSATGSSSYTYNFVHHVSFSDLYYNNDGNYFNLTGSCKNKYVYNGSTHSYSGSSFTTGGPIEGRLRGYNFTGDATINGSY